MKRIFILLFGCLLALSVISSCKKSQETNPNETPTGGVGIYVGNIATNFSEKDSQDNEITLESFRGSVILLTFSTMWCSPCRAEAPELVNLYNTYKERGLEIIQCIYQDEDGNPADLNDLAAGSMNSGSILLSLTTLTAQRLIHTISMLFPLI